LKQRTITAVLGIALLIFVFYFRETVLLNIMIAALSVIALYEMLSATRLLHNKLLSGAAFVVAVITPFSLYLGRSKMIGIELLVFIILAFGASVFMHSSVNLEQVATVTMLCFVISLSFTSFAYMGNLHKTSDFNLSTDDCAFIMALVFVGAWGADTGAYFVGRFFGKHKLAPVISPKKTVEGAVGGILSAILLSLAAAFIYQNWISKEAIGISLPIVALISVLCAIVGMLGDLFTSSIKRAHGIKDFGNIMPGHGGVLDRFDSILLAAPVVYLLADNLQFIFRSS